MLPDDRDSLVTAPDGPAAFYTGLVAERYAPLRGSTPDPAIYERFSCTTVSVDRDDAARTQITRLRYVRDGASGRMEVERDWLLHWFSPSQFERPPPAASAPSAPSDPSTC